MTDSGTLATTAQVLLAIGEGASADQILEANTNIWILMAESEMEMEASGNGGVGLVANYASITASYKQWLAMIASVRAAWLGINQDQGNWALAITQSKLNVLDAIWQDGIKELRKPDVIDNMGL